MLYLTTFLLLSTKTVLTKTVSTRRCRQRRCRQRRCRQCDYCNHHAWSKILFFYVVFEEQLQVHNVRDIVFIISDAKCFLVVVDTVFWQDGAPVTFSAQLVQDGIDDVLVFVTSMNNIKKVLLIVYVFQNTTTTTTRHTRCYKILRNDLIF